MPIEREFKFVLDNNIVVECAVLKRAENVQYIKQGYLGKGGRVRSVQQISKKGKLNGKTDYIFTYKHDLSGGRGILEIETPISKSDFELAWEDAQQRVIKTRHDLSFLDHVWEIDCLKEADGSTYLILAECEVDPSSGRPDVLHPLVERHLVHAVEENDARFTNRKLSDPTYTRELLDQVLANDSSLNS